ncbi:DUF4864 domain-containing protein [Cochlodiniinecator piscidefendens]|uniref:DUF4864 domain-containing protein n=1 Tax=Cochlodiniinecator piscidefendens TaxID=2715756 RepID=UPI00140B7196|nr:DUF4864 domain-containing protein [Cochlodiniinecator piscidefendens]
MKRMFFVLAFLIGAPVLLWAQENARSAREAVILSQIDAFQRDDFSSAYGFASSGVRRIFENPRQFGQMVQNGYPMVYRPSAVEVLDSRHEGAAVIQVVRIEDQAGQVHFLAYEMIEINNDWKINGVYLLEAAGLSV